MHELSVVIDLLDIVEQSATKNNAVTVQEIDVAIGELAGIEFDAFSFAIDNAPRSEMLKHATFNITRISPMAKCAACNHEFVTDSYASTCPLCQSFKTELIKGNELKVISFKME